MTSSARPRPSAGEFWRDLQPMLHRREFWFAQVLVVAAAVLHLVVEATGVLGSIGPIYLFSSDLFFIPVVYAAVTFGSRGAFITGVWAIISMIPDFLFGPSTQSVAGEVWELSIVLIVGCFVGLRVDGEQRLLASAREGERARLESERRYRSLFNLNPAATLLVDDAGVIQEMNTAAAALLGEPMTRLSSRRVIDLLGDEMAEIVIGREEARIVPFDAGQSGVMWLEPIVSAYTGSTGRPTVQVILRDVTTLAERQRGIEAYARRTIAGREEERRRIARELHDGPLQSVILISRMLGAVEAPETPEGRRALIQASSLALRVAEELRQTSRNLRPSVLDDLGLVAALRSEANIVRERDGILVNVRSCGTPRSLASAAELTLYRVAQEALRNVERHARATRVAIILSFRPHVVTLVISDDGRGISRAIEPAELLAEGKLGLVGMIERVRLLGGTCDIRPGRRRGTVVDALVPTGTDRKSPEVRAALP